MKYQSNERLFVAGMTRYGKTYLVMSSIFPELNRVVVHDRKRKLNAYRSNYASSLDQVQALWDKGKYKIIFQPIPREQDKMVYHFTKDPMINEFNELCHMIYKEGNMVLIVDEAMSVTTANLIPYWYKELIHVGGEMGLGVISISQRPMDVHNLPISEAEHLISFRLELEGDRKKIAGKVEQEAMKLGELPKYYYMEYTAGEGVQWRKPI